MRHELASGELSAEHADLPALDVLPLGTEKRVESTNKTDQRREPLAKPVYLRRSRQGLLRSPSQSQSS